MGRIIINKDKVTDSAAFVSLCPFGAIEYSGNEYSISAACKMCKLCVKNGPEGAAVFVDDAVKEKIDKSLWNGICVYADHDGSEIHPVTYELIGKAKELAAKIGHKTHCLLIGSDTSDAAAELLKYGVDEVHVYDDDHLAHFNMESYTSVFEQYINTAHPCSILVGATPVGRQLAPRVAARFKTGLTADCTILDIDENTDLVQIRPAFGGNIMAEICTPNNRPQMATVRYKVMDSASPVENPHGSIVKGIVTPQMLKSNTKVLSVVRKDASKSIENADIIVVAGRGVKSESDLAMLRELAQLLGGELASTRPLVENGWIDAKNQIGLSGRTVRPSLIITCGVSGAIQFAAGMNNSDNIFAINSDKDAPIFKYANYGLVGDLYEIVPQLIKNLRGEK